MSKIVYTLDANVKTLRKGIFDAVMDKKDKQFKKIAIMCYEEEALEYFIQVSRPYSFAWIWHDKDTNEDGTSVAPHIHAVLKYSTGIRVSHLKKCFNQNVFMEVPFNDEAIDDYLVHSNHPDKYQYDRGGVHTWTEHGKRAFFVSEQEFREDTMTELINDLQTLSMRQLAIKYGRDMMLNYDKYRTFIKNMIAEETNALEDEQYG